MNASREGDRVTDSEPLSLPSDGDSSGRWLGEEELAFLKEVIASGKLTSTRGTMVKQLEKEFSEAYGIPHCVAASSGTAAVHTALAALDLETGGEVVTTPITDMGGITPILYEGLVPAFADVDPATGNVTAESISRVLGERTRAVIVVHLFGMPCEMGPIVELLASREIPLIEDCAQAYFAEWGGRRVGSFGQFGTFSMQQGKHMTCGEGGLVVAQDETLADRARLFVNKAWPYGRPDPDHEFPALNYRLSELQGAVARAQLGKVRKVVASRRSAAERLASKLEGIPGLDVPRPAEGDAHVYWRYCLAIDPDVHGDLDDIGRALKTRGVLSAPHYIRKPAFECRSVRGRARVEGDFPGTRQMLERALVLPWNESYTGEHVDRLADEIRRVLKAG